MIVPCVHIPRCDCAHDHTGIFVDSNFFAHILIYFLSKQFIDLSLNVWFTFYII